MVVYFLFVRFVYLQLGVVAPANSKPSFTGIAGEVAGEVAGGEEEHVCMITLVRRQRGKAGKPKRRPFFIRTLLIVTHDNLEFEYKVYRIKLL